TIEAGTMLSYGALARQLGRPKSVRAVGSANGANPVAIVVPCHRVIGADGSLTGYGGGISRKRWLLTHEGVALEQFATRRVAEAQGYRDGESIPITFVEQIIARIVSTIDAPVSVDFEGGYSDDNGALAENVARLLELGIIGINFADRVVQGAGLYPIDQQTRRIAAIREAARAEGVDLFINARTDLF